MKTETLALLLAASVCHAFLFYACGTDERACISSPDCNYDRAFGDEREGEE